MSDPIKLVTGDSKPTITLTLTDDVTSNPIDVSDVGTVVSVKFRAAGSSTLLSTIVCSKVDGVNGIVSFDFSNSVLDVDAGQYEGEIEIDFSGAVQTLYDVLKFRVREQF